MNNTEIFELCEDFSKQQDRNTYWRTRIVFCGCGRNLKSSQRTKEFDKNNHDVSSIPGCVIKKNSSRGAKHGQRDAAKSSSREARKPPIHTCTMWYNDYVYRHSLSQIGWTEQDIMLFDRLLGESFIRRDKSWNNSKFDTLDSHTESRRSPATIASTTWLCSSEKKNAIDCTTSTGKDSIRLQNHSSQSTNKTA